MKGVKGVKGVTKLKIFRGSSYRSEVLQRVEELRVISDLAVGVLSPGRRETCTLLVDDAKRGLSSMLLLADMADEVEGNQCGDRGGGTGEASGTGDGSKR